MIRGFTPWLLASVLAIGLAPHAALADEPPAAPPAVPPSAEPPGAPPPAPTAEAPAAAPEESVPAADAPVLRPRRSRDIVIEIPGERSRNNQLVLGGIAGAGLLVGALGLYWHLDSRDASDAVSTDRFIGRAWTEADIALVERADRSKTRATVAYVAGGGLLIGAVVAYIVTAPKSETSVIRTGGIMPVDGGAVATAGWSF